MIVTRAMPRVAVICAVACLASVAHAAQHVIVISVDGLRPLDLQALIDSGEVPAFARFQTEGAGTNNARVDQTPSLPPLFGFEKLVQTLPNHTSMMTGRPIDRDNDLGDEVGHGYTSNDDPSATETVHNFAGSDSYKPSLFDVAHDHGRRTALFASKGKFDLFEQTWSDAGAPDLVRPDDGTDKIDVYVNISNAMGLTEALIAEMTLAPIDLTFLHYRDPDSVGHDHDWGSPEYLDAIRTVDAAIASLLTFVEGDGVLAGSTTIILTADHAGGALLPDSHVRYDLLLDARIPFYVWGHGVAPGEDLYALNPGVRFDPGNEAEIGLTSTTPPIRNGDAGNLALQLLDLPAIAGSTYNVVQNLIVGVPCPADLDGNGAVGFEDLVMLLANWGPCGPDCPEDVDASGAVDFGDLVATLAAWGMCDG